MATAPSHFQTAAPALTEGHIRAIVQEELRKAPFALNLRQIQDHLRWCAGTPEGAVAASVGTLCIRVDGAPGTLLYQKQTGTGPDDKTGWVAIA